MQCTCHDLGKGHWKRLFAVMPLDGMKMPKRTAITQLTRRTEHVSAEKLHPRGKYVGWLWFASDTALIDWRVCCPATVRLLNWWKHSLHSMDAFNWLAFFGFHLDNFPSMFGTTRNAGQRAPNEFYCWTMPCGWCLPVRRWHFLSIECDLWKTYQRTVCVVVIPCTMRTYTPNGLTQSVATYEIWMPAYVWLALFMCVPVNNFHCCINLFFSFVFVAQSSKTICLSTYVRLPYSDCAACVCVCSIAFITLESAEKGPRTQWDSADEIFVAQNFRNHQTLPHFDGVQLKSHDRIGFFFIGEIVIFRLLPRSSCCYDFACWWCC